MAKTHLDANEVVLMNSWLKHVFFPVVRKTSTMGEYIEGSIESWQTGAFDAIYKAIVDRVWDIKGDLDKAFEELANNRYYMVANDSSTVYKPTKQRLAAFIANMCEINKIYWDDTQHTPEELSFFKKTLLGGALWNFECFVSQEPTPTSSSASNKNTTNTTPKPASTGASSSGSKLNRGTAQGIISQTKEILSGRYMYWIGGEFNPAGKTRPRIHVKPYYGGDPLKISYLSGQGYDDCVLFFETTDKATEFLNKCDANKPSKVAFLQVKKVSTDSNGYIKVNTEFGEAYILASKLHEMLEADARMEEELNSISTMSPEDLQAYTEKVWEDFNRFID